MKYVKILELDGEAFKMKETGRFILDNDGKIRIEGDIEGLQALVEGGIQAPLGENGKTEVYHMRDGEKFLQALRYHFCGAYCQATKVLEEK